MSNKVIKTSLFHITRRVNIPTWQKVTTQVVAGVIALLLCGIVSQAVGGNMGKFFAELFKGAFGTPRRILNLFKSLSLLLLVALAVTPAFKMKFWNIGAEGQVLMGALFSIFAIRWFGGKVPEIVLILIMAIFGILGGAIWAVIPAIFKAFFNTNETLFTLMMNYIAMGLISYLITIWVPSGSGVYGTINNGEMFASSTAKIGTINGQTFFASLIIILVATMMTAAMFVYLKYQKHGYELTVVGESINTAKYIGINVKKVIIRTMILSGIICGLAGFLIVSADAHTINTSVAGGRGFTAILVSWLSNFNPLIMVIMAFLVAFITQGATNAASVFGFKDSFAEIMTAIFFFTLIASTFFIDYKIMPSEELQQKLNQWFKKKKPIEEVAIDAPAEKESASTDEPLSAEKEGK